MDEWPRRNCFIDCMLFISVLCLAVNGKGRKIVTCIIVTVNAPFCEPIKSVYTGKAFFLVGRELLGCSFQGKVFADSSESHLYKTIIMSGFKLTY